jgi:hypothetical protein
MSKNEPAFPGQLGSVSGLSKREYFAAAALQGAIAKSGMSGELNDTSEITAHQCVKYADALLSALSREEKSLHRNA